MWLRKLVLSELLPLEDGKGMCDGGLAYLFLIGLGKGVLGFVMQ